MEKICPTCKAVVETILTNGKCPAGHTAEIHDSFWRAFLKGAAMGFVWFAIARITELWLPLWQLGIKGGWVWGVAILVTGLGLWNLIKAGMYERKLDPVNRLANGRFGWAVSLIAWAFAIWSSLWLNWPFDWRPVYRSF